MDSWLAGRHHIPGAIVASIGPGAVPTIAGPVDAAGILVFLGQLALPLVERNRPRRGDSTAFPQRNGPRDGASVLGIDG